MHYAFIADVNVHEGGILVVITVAAFLAWKQRKYVRLEGKKALPG